MNKTTCTLDPFPTSILVASVMWIDMLAYIFNLCITTGRNTLKSAVVKPFLKILTFDPHILKNYRPVSNLPFLSKVIDKVIAKINTIQETKLTPKAKTPKIHNFTAVRTDRLHKAGGGLITLIRDNITFTTTDIPSTINTHNTKLQMVKVHVNNSRHALQNNSGKQAPVSHA